MKIALIFNPFSGGKKAHQALPYVHKELNTNGATINMFTSEYHGHLQKISRKLEIEKYDAIISMGGDGTHFHVLNGLIGANDPDKIPPLGIIPVGTGNSFIKDLGILTVEKSIEAILGQRCKFVDICEFTQNDDSYYFINNIGLGFITDVVHRAQFFKRFNQASYLIGVFIETVWLKEHFLDIVIDHEKIQQNNCMLAVCNSKYIGGNMLIAPDAIIDDGLFDVIMVDKLSRFELLKTLPKIFTGEHINHPAVSCIKANHIKIKTRPEMMLSPEGELFGKTPSEILIHPKCLRYLC